MKLRYIIPVLVSVMILGTGLLTPNTANAHQPFCEFTDLDAASPWQVPDTDVSYAYYGNLYPMEDVDYFTFDAQAGQSVLLSMSIPDIEGQEDFAPVLAVFGPGLAQDDLADVPERVVTPTGEGAFRVPLGDEPEYWFEEFGRRYYWNWENYFFEAPESATYTVAVWHPEQELGRYSFVIGSDEIFGGDPECMMSFDSYWTPLVMGESPYREEMVMDNMDISEGHTHDDGTIHDHGTMLELSADAAPSVDLQVFPLSDGGYNLRIQTLNFSFEPQKVGMEPVTGEGHAHLYIDGEKITRIYGEWFYLETLPEGAQEISVGLYANNHQALAVDGVMLADVVRIGDLPVMQAMSE